jgi:uncharacterized protein
LEKDALSVGFCAVTVRRSGIHGRGVFAAQNFQEGDVIERCPVILLREKDFPHVDATALYGYCYAWGGGGAIALGYGSLYNHSVTPNAFYMVNEENETIDIFAERTIVEGEEVTISYGSPEDLWFDTAD